jgi:tetratricopeptide (TPR) repeat protein
MHLKNRSVLATGIILAALNVAVGGPGQEATTGAAGPAEMRAYRFLWGKDPGPGDERKLQRFLDRGKEIGLLTRLGDAAAAWVSKGGQSSKKEVDAAIEAILAQPGCSVDAYFAAAKIADLCGDGSKAIAILEDVVARHGSDDGPGCLEPVNVVAYYWIARIARQWGDHRKATSAYEKILENSKNLASKDSNTFRSMLYLAEIASQELKDQTLAVNRLDKAIETIESMDRQKRTAEWDVCRDLLVYQVSAAKSGKMAARQELLGGGSRKTAMALMTAVVLLNSNGTMAGVSPGLYAGNPNTKEVLGRASLRRATENGSSPIDRDMAKLAFGVANEETGNLVEAEKQFLGLFEGESYFSPIAGIRAARCKKIQGENEQADKMLEQVRVKYPGYDVTVKEVKESWKKNPPKKSQ